MATKYARTPGGVKSESSKPACIFLRSSGDTFPLGLAALSLTAASIAAHVRIAENLYATIDSWRIKGCSPGWTQTRASDLVRRVEILAVTTSPARLGEVNNTCKCSPSSSASSIMNVSPHSMGKLLGTLDNATALFSPECCVSPDSMTPLSLAACLALSRLHRSVAPSRASCLRSSGDSFSILAFPDRVLPSVEGCA